MNQSLIKSRWILSVCILLSVTSLSQQFFSDWNNFEIDKNNSHEIVINPLQDIEITANTGEKPQSKVWLHDNTWWAVLPNITGTKLWRLDEKKWTNVLHLSDSTKTRVDTRKVGSVTHILMYHGAKSELISVEYDSENKKYNLWTQRPLATCIQLEEASETATFDVDSDGRMWVASDDETEIKVRWSDSPYKDWSNPITIANGILTDDICTICAFPNGNIGVMWSNQRIKRFGFRIHQKSSSPDTWSEDEIPASDSEIQLNGGMADDHLNIAITSDGTLYAAVKTSYDLVGYPLIALLVRQPSGQWDKIYNVDDEGSRPIVVLNEKEGRVTVIYTSYRDSKIVCRKSYTKQIYFGDREILIDGRGAINNVTSTKQNITNEIVILASESGKAKGVKMLWKSEKY
jgi:hypothetical protein